MTNRIRKYIQGNQDLSRELDLLQLQLGGKAKEVIAEALKSKGWGDGFNVLQQAASVGQDVSFSSAILVIKQRVSGVQAKEV